MRDQGGSGCNPPVSQRECPPFAPEIVVEVRSTIAPASANGKLARTFDSGTLLVLDVMPDGHAIDAITPDGTKSFHEGDGFRHGAAP